MPKSITILITKYAEYYSMNDQVQILCTCNRTTTLSKDAVISEIKRLHAYNYEIITCRYCSRKFSVTDLEKAIGAVTFTSKDAIRAIDPILPGSINAGELYTSDDTILERLKKENLEERLHQIKIKEEELKKMQSGRSYDPKIVGDVDMENGTPGDRNCVRILKKEGELYAYSYIVFKTLIQGIWVLIYAIWSILYIITDAIWEIIKKINWCIACSIARISYFIGYIGLIIYSIVSLFILRKPIFEIYQIPTSYNSYPTVDPILSYFSTIGLLLICTIPLLLQLAWASDPTGSRWSKVIKKRADEIIK